MDAMRRPAGAAHCLVRSGRADLSALPFGRDAGSRLRPAATGISVARGNVFWSTRAFAATETLGTVPTVSSIRDLRDRLRAEPPWC